MPHRLPTRTRYALFTLLLLAGGMATRTGDAADARAPWSDATASAGYFRACATST